MKIHIVVGAQGRVGSVLVNQLSANKENFIFAVDNVPGKGQLLDLDNVKSLNVSIQNKEDLEELTSLVNSKNVESGGNLASVTFLQATSEPRLSCLIDQGNGADGESVLKSNAELRRNLWLGYRQEDLVEQFKVTVAGTQNLLQAIYNTLISSSQVSVVFLSSVFARIPLNQEFLTLENEILLKPPGYSASKSGLENYSRFLSGLFLDTNCRFNCIAPGPISADRPEIVQRNFEKFTAGGSLVTNQDVVDTILLLHSERARHINGSVIEISNGWGGF